jgi:tetraprenyl-beta-curcumene synthase
LKPQNNLLPTNPLQLMSRVYRYVLPGVRSELNVWRTAAGSIPDEELRKQAIASISTKAFHCQGGAVYAAANLPRREVLIRLIVAYQTISDYLDNLCDRSTSLDPDDFRLLHQSMLDAVDPEAGTRNYYKLRNEQEDAGYLENLVRTCQSCLRELPSYGEVQPQVTKLASLYGDLQVYKHIRKDLREQELFDWWDRQTGYPDIRWNEFAAATGSTLGIFMLFLAASKSGTTYEDADAIIHAYFPYVAGLHILLDYLIDQEEDRAGGDLNFCFYYEDPAETVDRLTFFAEQARAKVAELEGAPFHRMIIEGLIALYLSDPKVRDQQEVMRAAGRLMKNSPMTRIFFWFNSVWIRSRS